MHTIRVHNVLIVIDWEQQIVHEYYLNPSELGFYKKKFEGYETPTDRLRNYARRIYRKTKTSS
jgi:hypothetical protein